MLISTKAILFDLDGVIVDSAPFHFRSWKIFMSKHKTKFSKNDFKYTFGMTNEQILKKYIPNLTKEDITKMSEEKEEIYREIAKGNIKPIKGATDFVKIAKKRFKVALVSSTPRQNIDFILSEFSLYNIFDCIISASDITKGKPDPECFIAASRKLQVETIYCAVVEDSQHGIDAAKSAGCISIGILTTHKNLKNTDFLVKNFNELKKIFGL